MQSRRSSWIALLVSLYFSCTVVADPEWTDGSQWYPPSFSSDHNDRNRRKFSVESPPWLVAVAKLEGALGRCSATLVTLPERARYDVILTAAHCVPTRVGTLRATWLSTSGQSTTRTIHRLIARGDSPENDWALLQLKEPVPKEMIAPLYAHSGELLDGATFVLSGYSSDMTTTLGNAGRDLTYDTGCAHDEPRHTREWFRAKHCYTYPGASGGAYVAWWPEKNKQLLLGPLSSIRPAVNYIVRSEQWVNELKLFQSGP